LKCKANRPKKVVSSGESSAAGRSSATPRGKGQSSDAGGAGVQKAGPPKSELQEAEEHLKATLKFWKGDENAPGVVAIKEQVQLLRNKASASKPMLTCISEKDAEISKKEREASEADVHVAKLETNLKAARERRDKLGSELSALKGERSELHKKYLASLHGNQRSSSPVERAQALAERLCDPSRVGFQMDLGAIGQAFLTEISAIRQGWQPQLGTGDASSAGSGGLPALLGVEVPPPDGVVPPLALEGANTGGEDMADDPEAGKSAGAGLPGGQHL